MRFRLTVAALAIAGFLVSACGGLTDPAKNKSETYSRTLAPGVGAAGIDFFTVSNNGEFTVQFNSLTPTLPQINFCTGILVAPVVSGQCVLSSPVDRNDCAVVGRQALPAQSNGIITTGQYCIAVFDEGLFSANETYVVTLSHP